MNRFFKIADRLAVLALLAVCGFYVLAIAQPQPGDTTGIVTGTPSGAGSLLLMAMQLVAGAISTFLLTKVTTKLTWVKGWVTVFAGTVFGGLFGYVVNLLLSQAGVATGLNFYANALGNFVIASAIYEWQQHKAAAPPA